MTWLPRIEAVGLETGIVLLETGIVLPITNMLDGDGDETEEFDEVMTVVAGTDEFGWLTICLGADIDDVTVH